MSVRKRFRALLATQRYIITPGAFDSLTARLVQSAGFDCVYLTGGGFARASGYPDLDLLTMTEIIQFISKPIRTAFPPSTRNWCAPSAPR